MFPAIFHISPAFTKHLLCASSYLLEVRDSVDCSEHSSSPVGPVTADLSNLLKPRKAIRSRQSFFSYQAWSIYGSVHHAFREAHPNWKIICAVKEGMSSSMLRGLRVLWVPQVENRPGSWAFLPCGLSTECPESVERPVPEL